MSGRGIGVVGALFAAIDAGAENLGGRRRLAPAAAAANVPMAAAAAMGGRCSRLAAVAVLAVPLLVLATALVAYPLSFLVQMINVDAGLSAGDGVRRHGAVCVRAGRAADGGSAAGDAVPGGRVRRAGGRGAAPADAGRSRNGQGATAIAAAGGRASSARRGAPSRGCAISARRCGICSAGPPRRKSRRRPI